MATDIWSTIDYYSNFCQVDRLRDTKASTTMLKLKSHLTRFGVPDQVMGDNGQQFASKEFATFVETWDFDYLTSSPGNNKTNGKAESGVKTTKHLLWKSIRAGTDSHVAFLDYRNTPTQVMTTSPAQCLMGRRTKLLLPLLTNSPYAKDSPAWNWHESSERVPTGPILQAKYCSRTVKDLSKLSEGDVVCIKPFKLGPKSWQNAQVAAKLDEQSYTVETENGTVYLRNRQQPKETPDSPIQPIQLDQVDDPSIPKSAVSSIPTWAAEPVDKPLASTLDESGSNQHLRPQRNKTTSVPEGLCLLMNNNLNLPIDYKPSLQFVEWLQFILFQMFCWTFDFCCYFVLTKWRTVFFPLFFSFLTKRMLQYSVCMRFIMSN